MECESCQSVLAVTVDASVDGQDVVRAYSISHLPTARTADPNPVRIRGRMAEGWEKGGPRRKDVSFEQPLQQVADLPAFDPTLDVRKKKRAAWRQEAPSDWEQPEAAPPKRLRRRQRRRVKQFRRGAILLGLLALGWLAYGLVSAKPWARDIATTATAPAAEANQGVAIAGEVDRAFSTLTSADSAEVTEVLRRFVTAPESAAAAEVIRSPARVRPLMAAWHAQHPWEPLPHPEMPSWNELVVYRNIVVAMLTGRDGQTRIAAAVKTPQGFRADWESYVGWNEKSWEALQTEKPTAPTLMRVRVSASDYYNREFADATRWRCYRLSPLDRSHTLYAYVARNQPVYQRAETKVKTTPLVLAIVTVRFPAGATTSNQVEMIEWLEDGWVLRPDEIE
jgi:hypothetical protein